MFEKLKDGRRENKEGIKKGIVYKPVLVAEKEVRKRRCI